jgi:hypothetical protein
MTKSSKRKRAAAVDIPSKLPKAAVTITPPPDGTSSEPKSLHTVISTEELEITVETLNTLALYPGLIKSKGCRALRGAVHEFRQACTMGVNATGKLVHGPKLRRQLTGL